MQALGRCSPKSRIVVTIFSSQRVLWSRRMFESIGRVFFFYMNVRRMFESKRLVLSGSDKNHYDVARSRCPVLVPS